MCGAPVSLRPPGDRRVQATDCPFVNDDLQTYDTIRKKSLTWTQKLSDQFSLAHVAREKIYKKEETKTNKT